MRHHPAEALAHERTIDLVGCVVAVLEEVVDDRVGRALLVDLALLDLELVEVERGAEPSRRERYEASERVGIAAPPHHERQHARADRDDPFLARRPEGATYAWPEE